MRISLGGPGQRGLTATVRGTNVTLIVDYDLIFNDTDKALASVLSLQWRELIEVHGMNAGPGSPPLLFTFPPTRNLNPPEDGYILTRHREYRVRREALQEDLPYISVDVTNEIRCVIRVIPVPAGIGREATPVTAPLVVVETDVSCAAAHMLKVRAAR